MNKYLFLTLFLSFILHTSAELCTSNAECGEGECCKKQMEGGIKIKCIEAEDLDAPTTLDCMPFTLDITTSPPVSTVSTEPISTVSTEEPVSTVSTEPVSTVSTAAETTYSIDDTDATMNGTIASAEESPEFVVTPVVGESESGDACLPEVEGVLSESGELDEICEVCVCDLDVEDCAEMFVDELSTEQQEALASICDLDCDIADIGTMVTTLDGVVCDCTLLECCGAECAFSLGGFNCIWK
eukprot:UN11176